MKTKTERKKFINKELGEFPVRAVLSLVKDKGKFKIVITKLNTTDKDVDDLNFNEVKLYSMGGVYMTPLEVDDYHSYEELEHRVQVMESIWVGDRNDRS